MKQIKKTKKQESGRSMIEMVGVLAVMGLITAAAFVLITSAMRSQKLSRADDDIAALAAGVRLLYNNSADFSGITTATSANTLKALGFDTVKPAYGSDATYTIAAADCTTTGSGAEAVTTCPKFSISFTAPDSSTCSGLQQRTWANGGVASCGGDSSNVLTITFDDGK